MKTTILFALALLLSLSIAPMAAAQNSEVAHDTWSSGAPMPKAVLSSTAAALGSRIFLVGGSLDWNGVGIANTEIYNPASNTWSRGVPLPTPLQSAAAATVNNILYVFGGSHGSTFLNTVWAFDPQTKMWSAKSPMPTARDSAAIVVKNNFVYVIGGWNGTRVNNVESYDPATDTWTEETPLLAGKSTPVAGLFAGWIVAADGYTDVGDNGETEGLNPATNAWISGTSDPTPRDGACGGSIGSHLYVASGYQGNGGSALTLTESFNPLSNTWTRLADNPQGTLGPAFTVFRGKLYCFGGAASWQDALLNNVQIYQP
jgi:N-acetylneuraminic acid mutarotase